VAVFAHLRNSCILKIPCGDAAHYSRREALGGSHGNFHFKIYFTAKRTMGAVYLSLDSY
jgi:hypothetical protein